eukprot:scaffold274511_cov15-Tisochrysis_lutea.AAC.1
MDLEIQSFLQFDQGKEGQPKRWPSYNWISSSLTAAGVNTPSLGKDFLKSPSEAGVAPNHRPSSLL